MISVAISKHCYTARYDKEKHHRIAHYRESELMHRINLASKYINTKVGEEVVVVVPDEVGHTYLLTRVLDNDKVLLVSLFSCRSQDINVQFPNVQNRIVVPQKFERISYAEFKANQKRIKNEQTKIK